MELLTRISAIIHNPISKLIGIFGGISFILYIIVSCGLISYFGIRYKVNGAYNSPKNRKIVKLIILLNLITLIITSIHIEGILIGLPIAYIMVLISSFVYFIIIGGIFAGYELIILFGLLGMFSGPEINIFLMALLGAIIRTIVILVITDIAKLKYNIAYNHMKQFKFKGAIYYLNQSKNILKIYSHPDYAPSRSSWDINLMFPANIFNREFDNVELTPLSPYFNKKLGNKLEMMEDAIIQIIDAENNFKNRRWNNAMCKYNNIINKYPNLKKMLDKRLEMAKLKYEEQWENEINMATERFNNKKEIK